MKKTIILATSTIIALMVFAGCSNIKQQASDAGSAVATGVEGIKNSSDKFLTETAQTFHDAFVKDSASLGDNVVEAKTYLTEDKQKIDDKLDELAEDVKSIDIKDDSVLKAANDERIRLIEQAKVENQKVADAITSGVQEQYASAKTALADAMDKIKNFNH